MHDGWMAALPVAMPWTPPPSPRTPFPISGTPPLPATPFPISGAALHLRACLPEKYIKFCPGPFE